MCKVGTASNIEQCCCIAAAASAFNHNAMSALCSYAKLCYCNIASGKERKRQRYM
jgi:hypothetical protein